jgi:alpha-beta hydrolase superfamily lysophospholipase
MGCRNISRDEAVVRQFREDPLVFHGRFPVRTGAEILRAAEVARKRFKEVRVPLLILHGTADRVATVGASRALYEQAQTDDKCLRVYDGLYHEVLNEPERERVLGDLIEWIERRAE